MIPYTTKIKIVNKQTADLIINLKYNNDEGKRGVKRGGELKMSRIRTLISSI